MSENELTKDDMEAMKKDVAEAKNAIAQTELEKAKATAKQEVEKEYELKAKLDAQETARVELETKLQAQTDALAAAKSDFDKRLDELKTTKSPVDVKDPFTTPSKSLAKDYSPEEFQAIDDASRELFFQERAGK